MVQSNWGVEYRSLHNFLESCGITHRVSCLHTHQQNGVVERKHCHVVETGLALLYHVKVSLQYWDEAFQTACYLINRLPTPILKNQSPFEKLFHQAPDFNFLRVFGCSCWPNLRPYNSHKLQPRSIQCVFLSYSLLYKGYKCLHLSSNRIYISRDVIFFETHFPFEVSSVASQLNFVSSSAASSQVQSTDLWIALPTRVGPPISPTPLSQALAHSPALPKATLGPPYAGQPASSPITTTDQDHASSQSHFQIQVAPSALDLPSLSQPFTSPHPDFPSHPMTTRSKNHISNPKSFTDGTVRYPLPRALLANGVDVAFFVEPTCYTSTMKGPKWHAVMNLKFDALLKNQTWDLVPTKPVSLLRASIKFLVSIMMRLLAL